jgi:hypothetical protein
VLHAHRGELVAERAARELGEHALELAARGGDLARHVVEAERGSAWRRSIAIVASASSVARRPGVVMRWLRPSDARRARRGGRVRVGLELAAGERAGRRAA